MSDAVRKCMSCGSTNIKELNRIGPRKVPIRSAYDGAVLVYEGRVGYTVHTDIQCICIDCDQKISFVEVCTPALPMGLSKQTFKVVKT